MGGDLNALYPKATKLKGFINKPEISFAGDKTVLMIRNVLKEY